MLQVSTSHEPRIFPKSFGRILQRPPAICHSRVKTRPALLLLLLSRQKSGVAMYLFVSYLAAGHYRAPGCLTSCQPSRRAHSRERAAHGQIAADAGGVWVIPSPLNPTPCCHSRRNHCDPLT